MKSENLRVILVVILGILISLPSLHHAWYAALLIIMILCLLLLYFYFYWSPSTEILVEDILDTLSFTEWRSFVSINKCLCERGFDISLWRLRDILVRLIEKGFIEVRSVQNKKGVNKTYGGMYRKLGGTRNSPTNIVLQQDIDPQLKQESPDYH